MASPADLVIHNKLDIPIRTKLTRESWVEGGGKAVDGQPIAAHGTGTFRVTAKTGHHGELDIDLLRDDEQPLLLGRVLVKSIKDPQEGGALITVVQATNGWASGGLQIASYGERSSQGDKDLRRITFTLLEARYASLRYNEVSMKAAHNSYERNERFIDQLSWDAFPGQNFQCGCGGLELDIAQSDDGEDWSVGHGKAYEKDRRQLSGYLSDLTAYSRAHPGHDVITLHLDLKHVATDDFPEKLDAYIRARLLTHIYTPGKLMGSAQSLPEGAREHGWPTIEQLAGHILICLTGDGLAKGSKTQAKEKYAETQPKDRLCFADKDCDAGESPSDAHRVFFNYHIFHSARDKWMGTFRDAASRKDTILRAYEADSPENWLDALESGCNLLATNKIRNATWAAVGNQRFVKRTPLV